MDANKMRAYFLLGLEGGRLADKTFNDREIEDYLNKATIEITKERFAAWKNSAKLGYGDNSVRNAELAGLITSTREIARAEFMLGDLTNGALYGPDLDHGGSTQTQDMFGVFAPIPDEVLYILSERVNTNRETVTKRNLEVKEVTYSEYNDGIYNPYLKPYGNLIWSMDWGSFTLPTLTTGSFGSSEKEHSIGGSNPNMSGLNYAGDPVEINTYRSRYLIAGKGWNIISYSIHYIKLPASIVIDVQTPSLQVNCELAEFLHQDIVDKAVKLATASLVDTTNKYQAATIESASDE